MNTPQTLPPPTLPDRRPLCLRNTLGDLFAALRKATHEEYPPELLTPRRESVINQIKTWNTLTK